MKVQIFRDKKHEWRWRLVASNNKIIANGGESYKNRQDVENILREMFNNVETISEIQAVPKK